MNKHEHSFPRIDPPLEGYVDYEVIALLETRAWKLGGDKKRAAAEIIELIEKELIQ